jgi:hypothetical protein
MEDEQLSEISLLLSLAAWYRCWAELTESAQEKEQRVAMAELLEVKARKASEAIRLPGSHGATTLRPD